LKILRKPPGDEFEYEFTQFREVVPRNDRFDPVTKFAFVIDKWEDMFAVALRESSKVDIYFNGARVSSITDPIDTVYGVDVTFDEMFIQIGKQDIRSIKTDLTSRMSLEESV
jgi:DNA polymerase II small subunit/DNA polymerase delta subunit B